MKVGLLTLPLHVNYGGILQSFALMKVLKEQGHDVWFINYGHKGILAWKFPLVIIKRVILKLFSQKGIVIFLESDQRKKQEKLQSFINEFIQPQTSNFDSPNKLKTLNSSNFVVFIVGSDQVWREEYCRSWKRTLFLDFVLNDRIRRITYAASFGVDSWDYDENTTGELGKLAQKFNAISVREDSAVRLCKDYLNVEVEQHIDPTMLLSVSDYVGLIKDKKNHVSIELFTYILDESEDKDCIINKISKHFNYDIISFYSKGKDTKSLMQNDLFPSISSFLAGFYYTRFVVTDSYHGCIFAILFNKPFIAIGNAERGLTRFSSLLKMLGLEDRLIINTSNLTTDKLDAKIDWIKVNKILAQKRTEAFHYLNDNLV